MTTAWRSSPSWEGVPNVFQVSRAPLGRLDIVLGSSAPGPRAGSLPRAGAGPGLTATRGCRPGWSHGWRQLPRPFPPQRAPFYGWLSQWLWRRLPRRWLRFPLHHSDLRFRWWWPVRTADPDGGGRCAGERPAGCRLRPQHRRNGRCTGNAQEREHDSGSGGSAGWSQGAAGRPAQAGSVLGHLQLHRPAENPPGIHPGPAAAAGPLGLRQCRQRQRSLQQRRIDLQSPVDERAQQTRC